MSERSIGTSRKKYVLGYYNDTTTTTLQQNIWTFEPRFLSGLWTGLPAGRGFLSGRGVRGSVQNWPIFIRTVLRLVRKFWPILIRTFLRDLRVLSGVLLRGVRLYLLNHDGINRILCVSWHQENVKLLKLYLIILNPLNSNLRKIRKRV